MCPFARICHWLKWPQLNFQTCWECLYCSEKKDSVPLVSTTEMLLVYAVMASLQSQLILTSRYIMHVHACYSHNMFRAECEGHSFIVSLHLRDHSHNHLKALTLLPSLYKLWLLCNKIFCEVFLMLRLYFKDISGIILTRR